MLQYNTFYDFTSNYNDAKYVVFGVPFDNTSTFRSGSRWTPDIMRKMCYNFESYDNNYDLDMNDLKIFDAGNISPSSSVLDTIDEIYLEVTSIVNDKKIPIMIGGEHSLSYGSIKACSKYYHNSIWIITLDAHLDMKDEYCGIQHNHACISRNIYDNITKNYILVGVRSGTKEEWDFVKKNNILYITNEDIKNKGIKNILLKILNKIKDNNVYLSIDMDVLDPIYCSGVGNPEPFGIHPNDLRYIIQSLSKKIIGMDIVEVTPEYDNNFSAILATKLLREYLYSSNL